MPEELLLLPGGLAQVCLANRLHLCDGFWIKEKTSVICWFLQEKSGANARFSPPCHELCRSLWTAACYNWVSHSITTMGVVYLRELHTVWKMTLWNATVHNGDRGVLQKISFIRIKGQSPPSHIPVGFLSTSWGQMLPSSRYSLAEPSTTYPPWTCIPPHNALQDH